MINIVHLSNTPLVGAPGKISQLCNQNNYNSISIVFNDYPEKGKLNNKFLSDSVLWSKSDPCLIKSLINRIEHADIIHIHNDVSLDYLNLFNFSLNKQKFIYQTHSPLREGPLFFERCDLYPFTISKKLVVAQYQPRLYPDYIPVPNLVLDTPSIRLKEANEKLRVMFSPTHSRLGRWNVKFSEELEVTLKNLEVSHKIEIFMPKEPLSPLALMQMRRYCHVSIDEIVTGSYHQVSLEGLCCGNVVLNNADFFASSMLALVAKSNDLPPFLECNPLNIWDVLSQLVSDDELVRYYQNSSYEYFKNYLTPQKLFRNFDNIYQEVINEN